jgi:hypothetical protein
MSHVTRILLHLQIRYFDAQRVQIVATSEEPDTSLVVYLSLSSGPHVSFVPRHTWPSDYCRFSTTLSGPINWTCQGAEYPVLRTFTPLWPGHVLDIVGSPQNQEMSQYEIAFNDPRPRTHVKNSCRRTG